MFLIEHGANNRDRSRSNTPPLALLMSRPLKGMLSWHQDWWHQKSHILRSLSLESWMMPMY